ncbi:hypothetical protein XPA_010402 [Xanthoria parietina]
MMLNFDRERFHLRNAPPLEYINRHRQQLPPKHLTPMSNVRKIGSIYASPASHSDWRKLIVAWGPPRHPTTNAGISASSGKETNYLHDYVHYQGLLRSLLSSTKDRT